jgi:uncharacterized protein DUF6629
MCFSASASFVTSGVLSLTGTAAVREAKTSSRVLLAAIPLLFAAHQLAEGVVWLTLEAGDHARWQRPAMFSYLTVAKVVWPFWVPLSISVVERNPAHRKVLIPLLVIGAVSLLYQAYLLIAYPVSASISPGHHIHYEVASPPAARWLSGVLYFIPTVFPPFFCRLRLMQIVGLGVLGSFIFSAIYFREALGSVWCFFAALISVLIWFAVRAPPVAPQPVPTSH